MAEKTLEEVLDDANTRFKRTVRIPEDDDSLWNLPKENPKLPPKRAPKKTA